MALKSVVRFVALLVLVGGIGLVRSSGGVAQPAVPSLRLAGVLTQVEADRSKGQTDLFVNPGIYVEATAGAFEIDVRRQPDGSFALVQVRRAGSTVTKIRSINPGGPVDVSAGLPNFFHATLTNTHQVVVSTVDLPFCPSSGYAPLSRVTASGPDNPTYPQACGSSLTANTVWGLDQGWGTEISPDFTINKIQDGAYTVTLSIAPGYAAQLGISAAAASASVTVNVVTQTGGCSPIPCPPPVTGPAFTSRAVQQGARPPFLAKRPEATAGTAGSAATLSGVPNLQALPAHDFSIETDTNGHDYLDFGATIWNSGSGPLSLEGFRAGSSDIMNVTQFLYVNDQQVGSNPAGQFLFDPRYEHEVWDMPEVARYDLLDASGNQIVQSQKQSFCLAPTDPVDLLAPGADWQPDEYSYSECGGLDAIWIRESLPAGWGDTYFQSAACQAFDITILPNGTYQVRITTDPTHQVRETSYTDNTATVQVTLGGTPGNRTVTVG